MAVKGIQTFQLEVMTYRKSRLTCALIPSQSLPSSASKKAKMTTVKMGACALVAAFGVVWGQSLKDRPPSED